MAAILVFGLGFYLILTGSKKRNLRKYPKSARFVILMGVMCNMAIAFVWSLNFLEPFYEFYGEVFAILFEICFVIALAGLTAYLEIVACKIIHALQKERARRIRREEKQRAEENALKLRSEFYVVEGGKLQK